MDLNLPRMDGIAAAKAIRMDARTAKTPILALSASNNLGDQTRCIEAGMNDFIRAPVSAALLINTVQRWCQGDTTSLFSDNHGAPSSVGLRATSADSPTLEVARSLARLGGNSLLYKKLVHRFVVSFDEIREQLQLALEATDLVQATSIVHNLVSAAGNIGALRLQQVSQSFEAALRSLEPTLYLPQRLHFDSEFHDAFEAAKRVIAQQEFASRPPVEVLSVDTEERLTTLKRLILEHDTAAVEVVDALDDVLMEDPLSSALLRRVAQSVMAYDFESAALLLNKLTDNLNASAPGAPHD